MWNRRLLSRLVLAALPVVASAGVARAEGVPTLTVLRMDGRSNIAGDAAPELLEETILRESNRELQAAGFKITSGASKEDPKRPCDASCALETARKLKADFFITGAISSDKAAHALVRFVETRTGRELSTVTLEGASIRDLSRSFESHAASFFSHAIAASFDGATVAEAAEKPKDPNAIPAPADVAAPPADATRLKSGLAFKVLVPGDGKVHPGPRDSVRVHYTGWTTDGKMFDSSLPRHQPAEFPLDRVILGWTEVVQQMVVGEKIRAWIPQNLAYAGAEGKPAGMLVFEIELLQITPAQAKPALTAPADVAAPPADAERTASGLYSKVLHKGTGSKHPSELSTVEVHYTGWTTDGKMFDSSVDRGQPAEFPLNRVIPGWTEGVQLMVVGEKRRMWIPADLAYKGNPGAPQGMLVFDVELLRIVKE
jgi:FKBP-type peptidyl-prolyl cis-trans isomerase